MDEAEDNDVKFLRISSEAVVDIKKKLPILLQWDTPEDQNPNTKSFDVYDVLLKSVLSQLDFFQDEPQLLDAHLKDIVHPVVKGVLDLIQHDDYKNPEKLAGKTFQASAQILYVLCKVRGEKVIQRFLSNEPRYILPVLKVFVPSKFPTQSQDRCPVNEVSQNPGAVENSMKWQTHLQWEVQYVFLLWLAHLMLVPFDLQIISADTTVIWHNSEIHMPEGLPAIARDIINICSKHIASASREQKCAAVALVKLVLRPDMRKRGMSDTLITWALKSLKTLDEDADNVLECIGKLMFINGVIASSDVHDICKFFPDIYYAIKRAFVDESSCSKMLQSSAVAKKLAIKIQRNIVTQILLLDEEDPISMTMLGDFSLLEEVIDYLLNCLADQETPIRYASSKALGIIAAKLDEEMAEEVVEAVTDSLNEDVLVEGQSKNLDLVNSSRWHGLALTLSHMLFRRSPSPAQLPSILNALYLTLSFEQRSAIGYSIGSNVRDAANFGLWSLARRYTTTELAAVSMQDLQSAHAQDHAQQSSIHQTAVKLVVAACLDPTGNVRRGSSAALQELIGRHPNVVPEGISLVQIVDFHAVGLRQRAMTDVSRKAGSLSNSFRWALIDALFDWRGLRAADSLSRTLAASAIGGLCLLGHDIEGHRLVFESLVPNLASGLLKGIEWWHGYVLTIAEIIKQDAQQVLNTTRSGINDSSVDIKLLSKYGELWALFSSSFGAQACKFTGNPIHTEITVTATLSLIKALSMASRLIFSTLSVQPLAADLEKAASIFTTCLTRSEASTFELISATCWEFLLVMQKEKQLQLVESWLQLLSNSSKGNRSLGILVALASSSVLFALESSNLTSIQDEILQRLIQIREDAGDIETRVTVIRGFRSIIQYCNGTRKDLPINWVRQNLDTMLSQIINALNDYTINERGDVGSLVRLEAINFLSDLFTSSKLLDKSSALMATCYLAVLRLSLEKLDKIRLQAARALSAYKSPNIAVHDLAAVSTYEYFFNTGRFCLFRDHSPNFLSDDVYQKRKQETFLSGIMSTTGGASESVSQAARNALYDLLDNLTDASLRSTCDTILHILQQTITHPSAIERERLLLSQLETVLYLFDTGLLIRLDATTTSLNGHDSGITREVEERNDGGRAGEVKEQQGDGEAFKWMTLLSLVQKSHFKSSSLQKIILAVSLYTHFANPLNQETIPCRVKNEATKKLLSMLLHPYARVRVAAAEAVYVVLLNMSMTTTTIMTTLDVDDLKEKMKRVEWVSPRTAKGSDIDKVSSLLKARLLP